MVSVPWCCCAAPPPRCTPDDHAHAHNTATPKIRLPAAGRVAQGTPKGEFFSRSLRGPHTAPQSLYNLRLPPFLSSFSLSFFTNIYYLFLDGSPAQSAFLVCLGPWVEVQVTNPKINSGLRPRSATRRSIPGRGQVTDPKINPGSALAQHGSRFVSLIHQPLFTHHGSHFFPARRHSPRWVCPLGR